MSPRFRPVGTDSRVFSLAVQQIRHRLQRADGSAVEIFPAALCPGKYNRRLSNLQCLHGIACIHADDLFERYNLAE